MSGQRHVVSQLLIATDNPDDLDGAVTGVLNKKIGGKTVAAALGLSRRPNRFADPPGVAIIDSLRDLHFQKPGHDSHECHKEGIHLEDLIALADGEAHVSPNFIVVQMSHGRVLPISFPKPSPGPLPEPPPGLPDLPEDGHRAGVARKVNVAVIDSPLLADTNLSGVSGPEVELQRRTRVPVAELHGTFTAGIVRLLEPRADVELVAMGDADSDGFYSDFELGSQIMSLVRRDSPPDIISLSLGSVIDAKGEPVATKAAVKAAIGKGIRIFAAAGNDGQQHNIVYPAGFDGVYTVGAQTLDSESGEPRPAGFTNGGEVEANHTHIELKGEKLVDFWAVGVNVVSHGPGANETVTLSFKDAQHDEDEPPTELEKTLPPAEMLNIAFNGSACWSGCSVAVPIVAAFCATMLLTGRDPDAELEKHFGDRNNGTSFEGGHYAAGTCKSTPA